uniref:Uncharacterized protein n=1 Tax=Marseillevirus LCMAC103 TaxID=2506604 RepID=A0A481YVA9_9VIRU|nr:MAG: hypothetical protein LCMAC103_00540 [Marseillevirus LCMAC103]
MPELLKAGPILKWILLGLDDKKNKRHQKLIVPLPAAGGTAPTMDRLAQKQRLFFRLNLRFARPVSPVGGFPLGNAPPSGARPLTDREIKEVLGMFENCVTYVDYLRFVAPK